MWIKFLHLIGLTNLTDKQVEAYEKYKMNLAFSQFDNKLSKECTMKEKNNSFMGKPLLQKFKLILKIASGIIGFGGLSINSFLKLLQFPYFPTYILFILACLSILFLCLCWEMLSKIRIDMRIVVALSIPCLFFSAIYLFPKEKPAIQEVLNFWEPFISQNETKIVTGSPLVWTGPHDPSVGPLEMEPAEPPDQKIVIHEGERYFSENKSVRFNTINYMLPRMSFTNLFDFRTAYQLEDFLLPKFKAEILPSQYVESYNNNFILIGGPAANRLTSDFINKLCHEYNFKFRYEFLLTEGHEFPCLFHNVETNDIVGIGDSFAGHTPVVEYKPENPAGPYPETGQDGAIIIISFNPYFRDKTILIIAGFEENGTLAAIEILKKRSHELDEINQLYKGQHPFEIVVRTTITGNRPTAPKIIKYRSVD